MRYFEAEFVVTPELASRLVKVFFEQFNKSSSINLVGNIAKVKIFFDEQQSCRIVDVIGKSTEIKSFVYNGDKNNPHTVKSASIDFKLPPCTLGRTPSVAKAEPKKERKKCKDGIYQPSYTNFYSWIEKKARKFQGEDFFREMGNELGFEIGTAEWNNYATVVKIVSKFSLSKRLIDIKKYLCTEELIEVTNFEERVEKLIQKNCEGSSIHASAIIINIARRLKEMNYTVDEKALEKEPDNNSLLPSIKKNEDFRLFLRIGFDKKEDFVIGLISVMMEEASEKEQKSMLDLLMHVLNNMEHEQSFADIAIGMGLSSTEGVEIQLKVSEMVNNYQKKVGGTEKIKAMTFLQEVSEAWNFLKNK